MFQEDGLSDGEVYAYSLDNIPTLVSIEDNKNILKPFSEKEVLDVIWEMEPNKALVPDGFSFHFYRAC